MTTTATPAEQATLPQARIQVPRPYLSLMGLFLGAFAGMYSETALNIALPQLSASFGIELSLTQWFVVGYMLIIGIVLPFASLLLKWVTARALTLFALITFLIGCLISAFAPGFEIALIGRLAQGVGTGLVLPTLFSMIMEVIPPHKTGSAMGVSALVVMFATAIGPTLAGILIGALSWHWVFFSFALVLVFAIIFTLKFQVNPYELSKPPIDLISIVLSCLGFGGVVLGAGIASLYGWISAPTLGALLVGIVCLALYAKRQFGMEIPVLDLHVFTIQGFRVGLFCIMLNFGIILSSMYILPQFYQNGMLFAAAYAGIVMLPGGIINALVSMGAGHIFDRIGARIPSLIGFALSLVGATLLLFTSPDSSLGYVMTCHIIMMIGIPLVMSPCQTHALASLPHRLSTDGSTTLNTLQQVFGAICTAIATSLLAVGQSTYYAGGGAESAWAFTQGAHYGFMFTIALAIIGFLVALRIKKPFRTADTIDTATAKPSPPESQISRTTSVAPLLQQLMETEVYSVLDSSTALDALKVFAEKGISGAPVVNKDKALVGFISDGDIIGALSRHYPAFTSFYAAVEGSDADIDFEGKLAVLRTTTVGELATKNVLTVNITDDVRDICTLLTSRHLKKVPVVDGERMVGIINRSAITHYAIDAYTHEIETSA